MTDDKQGWDARRLGLIVAAVVAVAAILAGVIYLRPSERPHTAAAPPVPASKATPHMQGTAIAPGTVATWEWREGKPGLFHGEGLQLRLERIGGEEAYELRLSISGAGPPHEMTLSTAGSVDVAVGDFDRQAPGPEVLVGAYSGGAHCCMAVQVIERAGGGWRSVDLGSWDGGAVAAPVDYDKDGIPEIERGDDRFLYAFEPYAGSVAPPRFLNVRDGKMVDVSTAPGLKPQFEALLPEYRGICESGSNGGCAGYVAAAARAGKLNEAWRVMMKSHDRTSGWTLPTDCAVALVDDKCPAGKEITFTDFPAALGGFLKDWGYIAETPSVLSLAR